MIKKKWHWATFHIVISMNCCFNTVINFLEFDFGTKTLRIQNLSSISSNRQKKAVLCHLLLLNSSLFPADYNLLSKISFRFKDFDVIAQCCWFLFIKVALKISLIVHGLVLSLPVTKNSSTPIRDKKQAITLDRAKWRQRMEAFAFN